MWRLLLAAMLAAPAGVPGTLTLAQHDAIRSPLDPASAAVSADGRFVAFASYARLSPADTNDARDIYVFDRDTTRLTLESLAADGRPWGDCDSPRVSGDGRALVFEAAVAYVDAEGKIRSRVEIVWRDRLARVTKRVSAGLNGAAPNGWSRGPALSGDGRFVAFSSTATNLVPGGDANGVGEDVYLSDVTTGSLDRISVDTAGEQHASGASFGASISGDGRIAAFTSTSDLAREGRRGLIPAVFVRDLIARRTERLCAASAPASNAASSHASINRDGRYVAFVSDATNLAALDRNRSPDVFVCDRASATAALVSRSANPANGTANAASTNPQVSDNGRFVAFQSLASDLECARKCSTAFEDINLVWDVFVFDRDTAVARRISGDQDGGWMEASSGPAIDGVARVIAFSSMHPIDAADERADRDLFVRVLRPPY